MDLRKRSLAKSVTWRVVGIVMLLAISYLVTHDWQKTTGITVVFHGSRLVLYYFHERIWERVQWGRLRHPLSHLSLRDDLTAAQLDEIRALLEDRRYIAEHPDYEI